MNRDLLIEKIEDIKENVKFNIDDIRTDSDVADELVTFDLMSLLGYNRKKDRTIKRVLFNEEHIWVIKTDNIDAETGENLNLVVKTIVYGAEPEIEKCVAINEKYKGNLILSNNTDLFLMSNDCKSVLSKISFDDIPDYYDRLSDKNKVAEIVNNIENENLHNTENEIFARISACENNEFISTEFCGINNFKIEVVAGAIKKLISGSCQTSVTEVEKIDDSKINSIKDELNQKSAELSIIQIELENAKSELKKSNNRAEELAEQLREAESDKEEEINVSNNLAEELEATKRQLDTVNAEFEAYKLENKSGAVEIEESAKTEIEPTEAVDNTESEIDGGFDTIESVEDYEPVSTEENTETGEEKVDTLETIRRESEAMLNDIEDNGVKTYIGIVNGTLFQTGTIEEFISNSVSELYNICGSKALPRIFDGDILTIKQDNFGTCKINGKMYTIDTQGMDDNAIFNKLETLFNFFDNNVVFMYKAYNNAITEDFMDVADIIKEADSGIPMSEIKSNKDRDDFSDIDIEDDVFGTFKPEQGKLTKMSLMDIINAIDRIPSGIDCNMLKIVEYHEKQFIIASENKGIFDNVLYKLCMAIIAYSKQKYELTATTLAKIEFSKISKAIDFVSDETKFIGDGTLRFAIPGTHYALRELDIRFFNPIINTICDLIDVNPSELYIYVELNATDSELLAAGISTEKYNISYTPDNNYLYESDEDDEYNKVVFSGNILALSLNSNLDTSVMENVVKSCLAIKTGGNLNCKINDADDLAYVLTEILAVSKVPVKEAIKIVDSAIDIVSDTETFEGVELNVKTDNNEHYYLNNVTPAQYALATLFMYQIAMGNISAGILTKVNRSALEYYQEFNTNDPVKYVEAKACAEYALARIK